MSAVFEELFAGERNRTMDVLSSSLPAATSQKIASLLDLPGQPPAGFQLRSFVFGAPVDDNYVIARIGRDTAATRAGMVFAHALVCARATVPNIDNIAAVFAHLRSVRGEPLSAQRRQVTIDIPNYAAPPGLLCDMVAEPSASAAVTSSPADLEDYITRLWPQLFPAMRAEFRFGLAFSPEESDAMALNLAVVPSQGLLQWPTHRRLDGIRADEPAKSVGGASLTGEDGGALEQFANALELECIETSNFGRLSHAFNFTKNASNVFSDAVAGLRLVISLQANPNKGNDIKNALIGHVLNDPGPSSGADILVLRNVDFVPIGNVKAQLPAFENAVNTVLAKGLSPEEAASIIDASLTEGAATNNWQKGVQNCLRAASHETASSLGSGLSKLLLAESANSSAALKLFDRKLMDQVLAANLVAVKEPIATSLENTLTSEGYTLSEVAVLIARHDGDLKSALEMACERDSEVFGDGAINVLLTKLLPPEKLSAAMALDNVLVTAAAADAVSTNPLLLKDHELSDRCVQRIWSAALDESVEAWKVRSKLNDVQDALLVELTAKNLTNRLLAQLMPTPVGNWYRHPKRADVWVLLSGAAKSHALSQTATAWIAGYEELEKVSTDLSPEPDLCKELSKAEHSSELLNVLRNGDLDRALDVFVANEYLDRDLFENVIFSTGLLTSAMTTQMAERTGRLVVAREWRETTRRLYRSPGVTSVLRPYFEVCANHLSFWEQWNSNIRSPSETELLDVLIELAVELYPRGLIQQEVWMRAGGDLSKVVLTVPGADQWRSAIRQIRQGGTSVSANNLISVMAEDFPHNARLLQLGRRFR